MPYAEARSPCCSIGIVGVTCHDSHLAMDAGEAGADYAARRFLPDQNKEPKTQADIELLRWWAEMMVVPCVAIGGITVANAPALVEAGADFRRWPRGVGIRRGPGGRGQGVQRAALARRRIFGALPVALHRHASSVAASKPLSWARRRSLAATRWYLSIQRRSRRRGRRLRHRDLGAGYWASSSRLRRSEDYLRLFEQAEPAPYAPGVVSKRTHGMI